MKRNKHFAARKNVLANCYKIAVDFWHAKANILWKKMSEKSIFALTITQTKNCDKIYSHFAMAKLPLKNVSITLAPPLILFKQKM